MFVVEAVSGLVCEEESGDKGGVGRGYKLVNVRGLYGNFCEDSVVGVNAGICLEISCSSSSSL